MIFQRNHIDLIRKGLKTETRRLVRGDEWVIMRRPVSANYDSKQYTTRRVPASRLRLPIPDGWHIHAVLHANGRTKYEVGKDYAMQPGRCEKADGRIPPLTSIRLQRVQAISEVDAVKEGCQAVWDVSVPPGAGPAMTARELYAEVWDEINKRKADQWAANPWVWALGWNPPTATADIV